MNGTETKLLLTVWADKDNYCDGRTVNLEPPAVSEATAGWRREGGRTDTSVGSSPPVAQEQGKQLQL